MNISGATRSELIARLRRAERLLEENHIKLDDIYKPEYSCFDKELNQGEQYADDSTRS